MVRDRLALFRDILKRRPWLIPLVELLGVSGAFAILFLGLGGGALGMSGPAESGLYAHTGESIPLLWVKLGHVDSVGGMFRWLLGFFFQLAPMEDTEKPIFVVLFAYWALVSGLVLGAAVPPHSSFGIACLILTVWVVVCICRRLDCRWVGYLTAIVLLSNVLLITEALGGGHSLLGMLVTVIVLDQIQSVVSQGAFRSGRLFWVGFLCSVLFFTSHHVQVFFGMFVLLVVVEIVRHRELGRQRWWLCGWFALGVVAVFLYFGARDLALAGGLLDAFRRPEYAHHLQTLSKYHPYVMGAFLEELHAAREQLVPLHFGFLIWLLGSTEGIGFLIFAGLGTVLGLLGMASPRSPRVAWLFRGALLLVGANIVAHAVLRLPHIGRAYLATTVMAVMVTGTGLWLFGQRHLRRGKGFAIGFLALFAVLQLGHFLSVVSKSQLVPPTPGVLLEDPGLDSPEEITAHLESLRQKGVFRVVLPPLAADFSPVSFEQVELFCYFAWIKQHGVKEIAAPSCQIPTLLNGFSEHTYFQLFRGQVTLSPGLGQQRNIWLADVLGPCRYYVYRLPEILAAVHRVDPAALSCAPIAPTE